MICEMSQLSAFIIALVWSFGCLGLGYVAGWLYSNW